MNFVETFDGSQYSLSGVGRLFVTLSFFPSSRVLLGLGNSFEFKLVMEWLMVF